MSGGGSGGGDVGLRCLFDVGGCFVVYDFVVVAVVFVAGNFIA